MDIHESFESLGDLVPYLEEPWRGLIARGEWKGFTQPFAYWSSGGHYWTTSEDGESSSMQTSASDYRPMKDMLLDAFDIRAGILTGYFYPVALGEMQVEFASALASAYNDFQAEHWLEKDERFHGSIHLAPQDPKSAVREIDRWGGHPQMIQVMLALGGNTRAYGDPFFDPIFEAAQRNNLVVATHHNIYSPGAFGLGRYYIERHALIPQATQATLISLIFNGVFDRFPEPKFAHLEGGQFDPALVFSDEPVEGLPGEPVLGPDAGVGLALSQFRGLAVSSETDDATVDALSDVCASLAETERFAEFQGQSFASEGSYMGAEEFDSYIREKNTEFADLAEEYGLD